MIPVIAEIFTIDHFVNLLKEKCVLFKYSYLHILRIH